MTRTIPYEDTRRFSAEFKAKPAGETPENLEPMRVIDRLLHHDGNVVARPTFGSQLPTGDPEMTGIDDILMDWLRDAHAAEQQAETMLKGMASRLEHYPDLKARIEQHVGETQRQADRIRGCIEKRGGSTSTIKDAGGKLLAMGQALSGIFVGDEVMKGAIAGYAFENMEIASYEILVAAAEEVGDPETRQVCAEILEEERAMARWLAEHLPGLTSQYLAREQTAEATAKR